MCLYYSFPNHPMIKHPLYFYKLHRCFNPEMIALEPDTDKSSHPSGCGLRHSEI